MYIIVQLYVSVINSWQWRSAENISVRRGEEPNIAVVVPTCGEPPEMVRRTVLSILMQDWPNDSLTIVVSDDATNPAIEEMTIALAAEHLLATILYRLL